MRTKEQERDYKRLQRAAMTPERKALESQKRAERRQRAKASMVNIVYKEDKQISVMGLKIKSKKRIMTQTQFNNKRYFVIDSEGYTDKSGHSHLNLIAIYAKYDDGTEFYQTYTKVDKMDAYHILSWITDSYQEIKKHVHGMLEGIIFGGDYDFSLWLKSLDDEIPHIINHEYMKLVDDKETIIDSFMVKCDLGRLNIGYVPSKFLTFSVTGRSKITISDIFGLTKLSFVKSLKFLKINVPQGELDRMAHEKTLRGSFEEVLTQEVIDYNKKELMYLLQMVNTLHETLYELKWYPSKMYGVGAIGDYLLGLHNIDEQEPYTVIHDSFSNPKEWSALVGALEDSYFGGYIYPFIVGTVKGISIHHYDLHSAYPAYMKILPALKGGRWYRIDNPTWNQINTASVVSIVKIKFDIPKDYSILPVRLDNGNVKYLSKGSWSYNVEVVKACHESKEVSITPLILWEFIPLNGGIVPETGKLPFDYLNEIGDMKKATDKHLYPVKYNMLKLGMNNEYGKEIQVLGGSDTEVPTFYNIVYASAITGMTRAKLIRGLTAVGYKNALLAMTDSIFSLTPLPSNMVGEELGEFGDESEDEGNITDMTIIQSGFYFYHTDTGVIEYKHRGTEIKLHGMTMQEIDDNYKKDSEKTIKIILNWLQSPLKPLRLPIKSRFMKLTQGGTEAGRKKIGMWSKDSISDDLKNISFDTLFHTHYLPMHDLDHYDLSKQIISLPAISSQIALDEIKMHKGTHAVIWNKAFQENIDEQIKLQTEFDNQNNDLDSPDVDGF